MRSVNVQISSGLYKLLLAEKERLKKVEAKKYGKRKKRITFLIASESIKNKLNRLKR